MVLFDQKNIVLFIIVQENVVFIKVAFMIWETNVQVIDVNLGSTKHCCHPGVPICLTPFISRFLNISRLTCIIKMALCL